MKQGLAPNSKFFYNLNMGFHHNLIIMHQTLKKLIELCLSEMPLQAIDQSNVDQQQQQQRYFKAQRIVLLSHFASLSNNAFRLWSVIVIAAHQGDYLISAGWSTCKEPQFSPYKLIITKAHYV